MHAGTVAKRNASDLALARSAEPLYQEIRAVLESARADAYRAVNAAMVQAYWQVGRLIVEHEQGGRRRAGYGEAVIATLAERLTRDQGRGFDERILWYMRRFYLAFPILNAPRSELPAQQNRARRVPNRRFVTRRVTKPRRRCRAPQQRCARRCSRKNDAIAKYSVLSENRQISQTPGARTPRRTVMGEPTATKAETGGPVRNGPNSGP